MLARIRTPVSSQPFHVFGFLYNGAVLSPISLDTGPTVFRYCPIRHMSLLLSVLPRIEVLCYLYRPVKLTAQNQYKGRKHKRQQEKEVPPKGH